MCLDQLATFKVHRYKGWKVYRTNLNEELRPTDQPEQFFGNNNISTIPKNEWITDKANYNILIIGRPHISYRTGFHVFLRKKDAERWKALDSHAQQAVEVVRKVRFKQIVAKGFQHDKKLVVVKKIFVIP